MRTKVIIEGLNNSQKFRAVINGVIIGDCQVKDLVGNRFQQREQRIAVWDALNEIGKSRRLNLGLADSFGTNRRGIDVQVDLV